MAKSVLRWFYQSDPFEKAPGAKTKLVGQPKMTAALERWISAVDRYDPNQGTMFGAVETPIERLARGDFAVPAEPSADEGGLFGGAMASLATTGTPPPKLKPGPSPDDAGEVAEATFYHGRVEGPVTVPAAGLTGGVNLSDPKERKRVTNLADKIRESGRFDRIIIDDTGGVMEGQHRLEAARMLGVAKVPVVRVHDLARDMPVDAMEEAIADVGGLHPDQRKQILSYSLEFLADEGGVDAAQAAVKGDQFQRHYDAAFQAVREAPAKPPTVDRGILKSVDVRGPGGRWREITLEEYSALRARVDEAAARIVPKDARVDVEDQDAFVIEGRLAKGLYHRQGPFGPAYMELALSSQDPEGTLRHETVHALRDFGLFTDTEWTGLARSAERGKWIDKHNIRENYRGADTDAMIEEAVAHEYETWFRGQADRPSARSVAGRMFERVKSMLAAVRSALGIGDGAAVFRRVETGAVARRGAAKNQPAGAQGAAASVDDRLVGDTFLVDDAGHWKEVDRATAEAELRAGGKRQVREGGATYIEDAIAPTEVDLGSLTDDDATFFLHGKDGWKDVTIATAKRAAKRPGVKAYDVRPGEVYLANPSDRTKLSVDTEVERPGGPVDLSDVARKSDIIANLGKHLDDIPIRVGRVARGKIGAYKVKPEVVRIRRANDIPVAAKEIGHHINKLFYGGENGVLNWTPLAKFAGELTSAEQQSIPEGFAEFVRDYIQDPAAAAKERPPKFAAHFDRKLKALPAVERALTEAQASVRRYVEQPEAARVFSAISQVASRRAGDWSFESFYTAAVDRLRPVQKVVEDLSALSGETLTTEQDAYQLARLSAGWLGKATQTIENGTFDFDTLRAERHGVEGDPRPDHQHREAGRLHRVPRRAPGARAGQPRNRDGHRSGGREDRHPTGAVGPDSTRREPPVRVPGSDAAVPGQGRAAERRCLQAHQIAEQAVRPVPPGDGRGRRRRRRLRERVDGQPFVEGDEDQGVYPRYRRPPGEHPRRHDGSDQRRRPEPRGAGARRAGGTRQRAAGNGSSRLTRR